MRVFFCFLTDGEDVEDLASSSRNTREATIVDDDSEEEFLRHSMEGETRQQPDTATQRLPPGTASIEEEASQQPHEIKYSLILIPLKNQF